MSISVCMASYNGEQYIIRQLNSILEQLTEGDEVIIVDDYSSDGTIEVLKRVDDPRIKIYINDRNRGDVFSFNRSISLAKNEFIFLSDQDDIWIPGRVSLMQKALVDSCVNLVTTNFSWIDSNDNPIDEQFDGVDSSHSNKYFRNIVDIFIGKTNYFGCAMAFRNDFLSVVLPIPSYVESHDLWIALAGNITRSNIHIDENTFLKRKHESNATSTVSYRPVCKKLWSRVVFTVSVVVLFFRGLFR